MPGPSGVSLEDGAAILLDLLAADVATVVPFHSIRVDNAGETVDICFVGDWIVDLCDSVRAGVPILELMSSRPPET